MIPKPGLYVGSVYHRRVRPQAHALRYRAYWLLVELGAEGPQLAGQCIVTHNRRGLMSYLDRDFASGADAPIRPQIEQHLTDAGIADAAGMRIFLFALPRVLGYTFNPLSIYFCYAPEGELRAIAYEVHNTFKQRHTYVAPVAPGTDTADFLRQSAGKRFYVSPFLPMDMAYEFTVAPPAEHICVFVNARSPAALIATGLRADWQPLSTPALLRALLRLPLMTLKVIAAIHWEALRLWWKGASLVERPSPPAEPVTIAQSRP